MNCRDFNMNHRQLTLKIKHPEKCAGNILFATHKKMFYVFAKWCDTMKDVSKWMYKVPAGTYMSKLDGNQYEASFDFVISCTSGEYYVKFVSLTKKDKKLDEEREFLKKICAEKNFIYKEINELNYKAI